MLLVKDGQLGLQRINDREAVGEGHCVEHEEKHTAYVLHSLLVQILLVKHNAE